MKACIFICLLATASLCAREATITVNVNQPGIQVSPLLFGIFFEEINRAGDGGIYAEMVQNRSFEDAAVPLGWSLLKGEGKMSLDRSQPLNANNPTSLRLEGGVSVANRGFKGAPYRFGEEPAKWMPEYENGVREMPNGIALQQGKSYRLSLYVRGQGPLTAAFEKADGAVLATHQFQDIGPGWKPFEVTLTPSAAEPDARLVLTGSGTVWLDMVSLFPEGELFRSDLVKLLAEMKPAFVRFPGGCYVEGNTLQDAFRWKKTIGDIAGRPGHWCRWGYHSSDGLGYHEYLLLCEALGAEPLYVINCGMSHEEQRGVKEPPVGAELQEYVQDALDAIEYANGPADSKWGALRAKAGHPAPFNMRLFEIGNENGGPIYDKHYALFYDAIKAKYPEMQLIANVWSGVPKSRGADIIDEHYYNTPDFFLRNAGKYDTYDRSGPKIYVGEYAVTRGCGRGNLIAAVGEAAFMTGMERNSDIVAMASYAPLFEHVGWKRWNPNAILFDAARAYATPSWHVQCLFGANRADVVLPVEVSAPLIAPTDNRSGMIGVGTWHTRAEYKDIKVVQGDRVLFEGAKGWKFAGGDWQWDGEVLRQSGGEQNPRAFAGDPAWKDYTLTLKARKLGGMEGFLIIFAAPDERGKSWWNLGGWGNRSHGLEVRGVDAEHVPGAIETNRWYDIKVELQGPRIRCWLDGQLIHDVTSEPVPSLYAVAGRAGQEIILKVVNAAAEPLDTAIHLNGVGELDSTATITVLTSAAREDENSFEEPAKVAPEHTILRHVAPKFRHSFPANSVTVLRTGSR